MAEFIIRQVTDNKKRYLPLLLLADEKESMVDLYLSRGTMYVMEADGEAVCEAVVTEDEGVLEVKNLAVRQDCQRHGYGRAMLDFVAEKYSGKYPEVLVGTGDSPLTVPFYEKCGFVRSHVVKDFFTDNYDFPIIEAGVQLRDMVYLKKSTRRK